MRLEKNRGVFVRQISRRGSGRNLRGPRRARRMGGRRARADRRPRDRSTNCVPWSTAWTAPQPTGDVDAYYPLNLEFHDRLSPSQATPSCSSTYRRLVNELNLLSGARRSRRVACCRCRRASIATSSNKIAGAQCRAAGKASATSIASASTAMRMHRRSLRAMPTREAAQPNLPRPCARVANWQSPPEAHGTADAAQRQRPRLSLASHSGRRRLRRRLRDPTTSTRQSKQASRLSSAASTGAAPASPPTASCHRSPIRTIFPSSPARRLRCTAFAATISGTARRAPK